MATNKWTPLCASMSFISSRVRMPTWTSTRRWPGSSPRSAARSPRGPFSAWGLLEHMRISQWDILEFSRDPKHVSPKWPAGYWPAGDESPGDAAWEKSAQAFRSDLDEMAQLVTDPKTDLFARIPHGDGQTILREALVLADHNSYHIGQMVLIRRLLGDWAKE